MSSITGRAFVFGDNIDTDVLAPGSLMKLPPAELAEAGFETVVGLAPRCEHLPRVVRCGYELRHGQRSEFDVAHKRLPGNCTSVHYGLAKSN